MTLAHLVYIELLLKHRNPRRRLVYLFLKSHPGEQAMTELITAINEIVKYGLKQNIAPDDKEKILEKNLMRIYSLYFEAQYTFEENDYFDFTKQNCRTFNKT